MKRFEGQVAIVTGGAAGMGKAYVQALTDEGASVMIADYNENAGLAAEEEFKKAGKIVEFFQCDVSDEKKVKAVADQVFEKYGRIDILINNAQGGKDAMAPLTETTYDFMMLNWATGFLGTWFFMKYTIPYMKQREYGRIINVASFSGIKGKVNACAYGPQKEAIRGLTRVAANEFGEFNINCNVICPSAQTEEARKWAEAYPDKAAEARKLKPIKHPGNPEKDIAPVVMFLASEDARFVTGQTIGVDGGQTMMP